ncbi:hypothetical protein ACIBG8_48900 [Nonomuraea sp. NPDC050556]|uniref:hypothetical protein n=1 Tax=Nonomuraea sp. NPDC050556 TaxID=3364369 RepID=UPI0037A52B80
MTNEIYPAPTCECGAQLEEGQSRCLKCLARDRWIKKQAARNKRRRGETRRPPRGPRNSGKSGVIWS